MNSNDDWYAEAVQTYNKNRPKRFLIKLCKGIGLTLFIIILLPAFWLFGRAILYIISNLLSWLFFGEPAHDLPND